MHENPLSNSEQCPIRSTTAGEIQSPDVLLIDGVYLVPKTVLIKPQDVIQIVALGTPPESPVAGQYIVEADGSVVLGPVYGRIDLKKITTQEAEKSIEKLLSTYLKSPKVSVGMFQSAGTQHISGEHLVTPDGTVKLGVYGRVKIAGLKVEDAQKAVESHLKQYFSSPKVSLDVFKYNSSCYYVIIAKQGKGDEVHRFTTTGNETVLDAVAKLKRMKDGPAKKIRIARPDRKAKQGKTLDVDWNAITRSADATSNYQLLPGDRLILNY